MLYSLIYVSELISSTDQDALDRIRSQSIECNQAAGITGLLLHTPDHFCQLLQGPKVAVEETMQRIRRDTRHNNPIVLLRTDFTDEMFPDWSMATSRIPAGGTAAVIARTHTDKLAEPADIDQIVAVMQQYRYADGISHEPVVSRSAEDHSLSALGSNTGGDAFEPLLQLGARMFEGYDLLFLQKQPGAIELSVATTVPAMPGHIHEGIAGAQDQLNVWCAQQLSAKAYSTVAMPAAIALLCNDLGYSGAEGHVISVGLSDNNQTSHNSGLMPAAFLWFLQRETKPGYKKTPETLEAQAHFVSCIGQVLEQQRLVFESKLLQRKSQRQQLAIAASHERQELVLNVASSAIVALDSDCRVLMINRAARSLLGLDLINVPFRWPGDIEFVNVNTNQLLDNSGHPVYRAVSAAMASPEQPCDGKPLYENHVVGLRMGTDKPMVYLKCSAVAVNESDSAVAVVLAFDDITELERSRDRIRRSDRLEALGHLTGGIAHDFNNLLATVLNAVELAGIEERTHERQQLLNLAIDTVHRGTELTNRLVAFAVAQPIKPEIHRLSAILKAVEELAMASVSSDVSLVIDQVPDSFAVLCDAGQLENALLNLLINSRDAIVSSVIGSKVQVSAFVSEATADGVSAGTIELCVTDNGPGMTETDILRATDPFFTTKESSAGSGLGLSMVYRFIQQCGGELLIENAKVDGGSGLRVRLLIEQANADPDTDPVLPPLPEKRADQSTILLIEDDLNLGGVLKAALQRLGHRVIYLSDVDEVIWFLDESVESFDLLLTDVVMSGSRYDGFSLAERALERRPNISVAYMSGYVRSSNRENATLHGPILPKPISITTLAQTIEQELSNRVLTSA
jgi:nitrogen-specific signal transduction histidine kinase/ActR/RegA family two-component response regulator